MALAMHPVWAKVMPAPRPTAMNMTTSVSRRCAWLLIIVLSFILCIRIFAMRLTGPPPDPSAFLYDVFNDTLGVSQHIAQSQATNDLVIDLMAPERLEQGTRPFKTNSIQFQKIFVLTNPNNPNARNDLTFASTFTSLSLTYRPFVTSTSASHYIRTLDESPQRLEHRQAHMPVLREIIESNIATALILEEAADWDLRIKKQMWWFALAARTLIQPLAVDHSHLSTPLLRDSGNGRNNVYADKTYPIPVRPGDERAGRLAATIFDGIDRYSDIEIDIRKAPALVLPSSGSPYGDDWSLLRLGNCGDYFVNPTGPNIYSPRGRVILPSDQTVPALHNVSTGVGGDDELVLRYPDHTRVVHHSGGARCTVAYAVTRDAARKLLWEASQHVVEAGPRSSTGVLSEKKSDKDGYKGGLEGIFRRWCSSSPRRNCLTVQPGLFSKWDVEGPDFLDRGSTNEYEQSGGSVGASEREGRGSSPNIRLSVRLNLGNLLEDREVVDQYPDFVERELVQSKEALIKEAQEALEVEIISEPVVAGNV